MKKLALIFIPMLILCWKFDAEEGKVQRIMPGPGQESVWDYPRPPKVDRTSKKVQVIYDGILIAETIHAIRVLETSHPPVYYIPRQDVRMEYLNSTPKTSTCEWKGMAVYYDVKGKNKENKNAAWSYPKPSAGYEAIRDYIAFYPKFMDACYVNGELVRPEPGEYYGGWVTHEIVGPFAAELKSN
jgi:uncharacterized protein (DUF427 family)